MNPTDRDTLEKFFTEWWNQTNGKFKNPFKDYTKDDCMDDFMTGASAVLFLLKQGKTPDDIFDELDAYFKLALVGLAR